MNNSFPIKELKEQLEKAKKADIDLKYFGAKSHKYCLNAPASLNEVKQFEESIGVELPEEYRNFLLLAGNGGAGPFYGLYSLQQVKSWLSWDVKDSGKAPILSPDICIDDLDTKDENWKRGCIVIGTEGDTYFTCLMVTGPYRGRVVYIEYEGSWVFFPKEPNFLCWYQRWLKEVINHYNIFWFATNLDGNEQQLRQHYMEAETKEEKLDVIYSMDKFPSLTPISKNFIKKSIWEWIDDPDTRSFLQMLNHIDSQSLYGFLEKRWELGMYDAVIYDILHVMYHIDKGSLNIVKVWWERVLQKLPHLSNDASIKALKILRESGQVELSQVRFIWDRTEDSKEKLELLDNVFPRFPAADKNIDIWISVISNERKDLDLLKTAIHTAPNIPDPQLKEAISQIIEEFSFAVELILNIDTKDTEALNRYDRRRKENDIYRSACEKWKDIGCKEAHPYASALPRPYQLELKHSDEKDLIPPNQNSKKGIAIHPMIALALKSHFHSLPSTPNDWDNIFDKVKKLSLELNSRTVSQWDDENRTVTIFAPDNFPLPAPYRYDLSDWSAIGRMSKLKNLSVSRIFIDDYSFLTRCVSLEKIFFYNTNFSDCRLLLKLPKLKSVEFHLCNLENTNALKSAKFKYAIYNNPAN